MKNNFFVLLNVIALFFNSVILSQSVALKNSDWNIHAGRISSDPIVYIGSIYDYGTSCQTTVCTSYVSLYHFSGWNLPSDAYDVKFYFKAYSQAVAVPIIVGVPNDVNTSQLSTVFEAVSSSGEILLGEKSTEYIEITSYVNARISSGYFYLGVRGGSGVNYLQNIHIKYTYRSKINFTVRNNHIDGTSGLITINGSDVSSPATVDQKVPGDNVSLSAVDQPIGSYNYIWKSDGTNRSKWEYLPANGTLSDLGFNRSHQVICQESHDNASFIAQLKRICNINFQSEMGENITVNGISFSSPTQNFNVPESESISASVASSIIRNNIEFKFHNWSPSGSTSNSITINPTSHQSYLANYKGYPMAWNRNLHLNAYSPNTRITIYWNQYPNPDVRYQIWRWEYNNHGLDQKTLIRTLSNNVTSWTDQEYNISLPGQSDCWVGYDVRALYYPDYTTAGGPENYVGVDADLFTQSKANAEDEQNDKSIIKDYFVTNYPNPFNPNTTIEYHIAKAGLVKISVYNSLGEQIEELVNEFLNTGYYRVIFNASNLPTGVYYYSMKTENYSTIKKMLLMK